jgi:hypothetical protein
LEFSELIDGAVEQAVGGGAGAVDGAAVLFGAFVEQRILTSGSAPRLIIMAIRPGRSVFGGPSSTGDFAFYGGTAAQAPGGSGDFGGE